MGIVGANLNEEDSMPTIDYTQAELSALIAEGELVLRQLERKRADVQLTIEAFAAMVAAHKRALAKAEED